VGETRGGGDWIEGELTGQLVEGWSTLGSDTEEAGLGTFE
jgi:hypothetical protein